MSCPRSINRPECTHCRVRRFKCQHACRAVPGGAVQSVHIDKTRQNACKASNGLRYNKLASKDIIKGKHGCFS